ncbi:DUF3891 family protein [Adhaeretor mobilis]|uniref:DUF3891 family protein n=1 Tax=Adhaeretor mobilis TaxID=1930276 RepID=A0A517N2Y2_9BACT|nr:DUF3891 family protein [Adhaeretor mobilis]QDT01495.1 hypothetical protein HG15A2_48370 [Adhaeretor mobilis]
MLRREITAPDGSPHWLLIPQTEHARLSGELAEAYQPLAASPPGESYRNSLLKAIHHHDDGWREWDASPELDSQGRPLSFLELENKQSLIIWERSVQRMLAHDSSFVAAYLVAEHFKQLLAHSEDSPPDDVTRDWLEEISEVQILATTNVRKSSLAELEAWLPAFDALSLWMCKAILAEEQQFALLPEHAEETKFTRVTDSHFTAKPWNFESPEIELTTKAITVPVANYATSEELFEASEPYSIAWRISK